MIATIFKNITDVSNPHHVDTDILLDRIRTGKSKSKVEAIRNCTDREIRNKLKCELPSVCWSGVFTKRGNSHLIEGSKLIVLDFDHIEDAEGKKMELIQSEYCYACWVSPSGNGVKMLVRVSTANHLGHFLALKNIFSGIDESGKDIARVCYESYDPHIYINKEAKVYATTLEEKKKVEPNINSDESIYEKLKSWVLKQGQSFVDGNRNNFITKLAAACNRAGVSRDDAKNLIYADFVVRDGSFSEKELESTLNGIYSRYTYQFGQYQFNGDKFADKKGVELTRENFDDGLPPKDIIFCNDVAGELMEDFINGIQKGDTTFFPELDEHWRWLKGQLNIINGYGNLGKTTFFTQLKMIRSVKAGDKWCIFSPEQSPSKFFFRDLVQIHSGKTFDKGFRNSITKEELKNSIEFVNEHFYLVEPKDDSPTPEYMLERFFEMCIKKNVDGCLIDPFNQLANHWDKSGGRDLYLEKYLNTFKMFAKSNNIYFSIIAHPKTPKFEQKGEAPTVFDLSGGAMWNNKADNILCYHRPNYMSDKTDPSCTFESQKIRFQQIVGMPGKVDMEYDRAKFRYYINKFNPLDGLQRPSKEIEQKSFYEVLGDEKSDGDFWNKVREESGSC